jgi:hypothetical protein
LQRCGSGSDAFLDPRIRDGKNLDLGIWDEHLRSYFPAFEKLTEVFASSSTNANGRKNPEKFLEMLHFPLIIFGTRVLKMFSCS